MSSVALAQFPFKNVTSSIQHEVELEGKSFIQTKIQ